MTRTLRAGALTAFALMLALTACTSPSPSPTQPTPSASEPPIAASPTPTADADPLTTVTSLVVRPEALQLVAADGAVVTELDYLGDATAAIEAVTTVFGSAPADEEFRGTSHFPPSTAHRWEGFTIWEVRYVDNWVDVPGRGETLGMPAFRVQFTGPEAFGIVLSDVGGRRVGGSWDELMGEPGIQTNPSGCSGPYVDFVSQPRATPDGTPFVQKVSVDFQPSDDRATIARIGAPMTVHENGCT